jgi:hypothetical protein
MGTLKTTNVEAINIAHPSASVSNIQLTADGTVVNNITFNTKTDNYTLILSDAGKLITVDSATAKSVTIPLNSSVAYPLGTVIAVAALGDGVVDIKGDSGVTVNSTAGTTPKLSAKYAGAQCYKIATNTWLVIGSITA